MPALVVVRFHGELHDVCMVETGELSPLELEFGPVTVTITLVEPEPVVARPPVETRPYVFGAASLAVHLGVWLAAMLWPGPPPEPIALPGLVASSETGAATRIGRYAMAAQTVRREHAPPPETIPITTDTTPAAQPSVTEQPALPPPPPPGRGLDKPVRPQPQPLRREPTRFDPTTRPDFDIVETGPYTTLATGRAAGEHYGLAARKTRMVVVSCDARSCVVVGGDDAGPIRKAIEARLADIAACYEDATKVELDFGLADDGKALGLTDGSGGAADGCVARIIRSIQFSQ
jgi:hypothetical protein